MTPEDFLNTVRPHVPALLSMAAIVAAVVFGNRLIRLRSEARVIHDRLQQQVLQAGICTIGAVLFILALPISDQMKGQLLTLAGLLGSAVIGLSSTTFVGNAMAGLMLSALGNLRPGDYLKVGEHFGRISDRGLFHTEIQTEDRRLTSLPNLVTNPIEVVPASRTIVAACVSLGYDISRTRIELALTQAASSIGLKDPFVQIKDLGDYAVTYRAAGVLEDVRSLISSHSALRAAMLDALHNAELEIVSPAFENQRSFAADRTFLPDPWDVQELPERLGLEAIVFDKADLAVTIERLSEKLEKLEEELETLQAKLQVEDEPSAVEVLEHRVERKADLVESYRRAIREREHERTKL
jgi:small-conductance mechanosensitive channel